MRQCTAIKANGQRCTLAAKGQQDLCWMHDPANASERRRTARRGGRGKASREVVDIKAQLASLTQDVLSGELETSKAAVANQLINTRLRALELERRWKELTELEDRIAALERTHEGIRDIGVS